MTGTDTKIGWAELALRKGGVAVYEAGAVEQVVDAVYAAGLDHHVERARDGAGLECWIVQATPAESPTARAWKIAVAGGTVEEIEAADPHFFMDLATVELDADLIEAHGAAA